MLFLHLFLKEQSKLLWKIRDELSKNVSNNALKALLEYNNQQVPGGESKVSTDILLYQELDDQVCTFFCLSHKPELKYKDLSILFY